MKLCWPILCGGGNELFGKFLNYFHTYWLFQDFYQKVFSILLENIPHNSYFEKC